MMNDNLTEFWRNTWVAWRAGTLSTVSPKLKESATNLTFERWHNIISGAKNQSLDKFFFDHPPQPDEFLVSYSVSEAHTEYVITSQRLWMFSNDTNIYCVFDLRDIAQLNIVQKEKCFDITVRFRDNTERVFKNIVRIPSDEAIKYAIERYKQIEPIYEILHDPKITELLLDPKDMICPSCHRVSKPIKLSSAFIRFIVILLASIFAAGIIVIIFGYFKQNNQSGGELLAGFLILITIVYGISFIRRAINHVCPLCTNAELMSLIAIQDLEDQKHNNLFYYSTDAGRSSKGPISIETLYSLYNSNRIQRDTLIRKGYSEAWQRIPVP
jgi:hypothetical protein